MEPFDPMSAPYLKHLPNGTYQYRRVIPEHLRGILGKREIKQSFGKDFAAAMKLYAEYHKRAEEALEKAKLGTPPDTTKLQALEIMERLKLTPDDLARRREGVDPDNADDLAFNAGYDAAMDEAIGEFEEAARQGKQARYSLEALRALMAGVIPKDTHTIATALEHYRKSQEGADKAKNRQLENRIDNLKKRMVKALGTQAVTKLSLENFGNENARKTRDYLLSDGLAPTL